MTDDKPFSARLIACFIILALLKLWLVGAQTVSAMGYFGHDDRLFLNLAKALLTHGWLGHYSHMTLIKGPFYPFWIAISFLLGIPLLLSQHLLYITACAAFVIALRPLLPQPKILLLVYVILLFNPMSYTDQVMTRVIREGIYPALTIIVVSCAIGLMSRNDRQLKTLAFWSIGLGSALSAFWLTREEGVLIIPSILTIIGFATVRVWRTKLIDWRRLFLLCILPMIIWMASIGFVAGINKYGYGIFATVDVKSRDFLAAYGALSRVEHANFRPYVPVPKEAREHIYQVSPSFSELRSFLEGDPGKEWSKHGCQALSVCDDIAGGWFMWAFRDAVAAAGHYKSGASAAKYYHRMAAEINAACDGRKLDCGAKRASLMPPWRSEYTRPLLNTLVRATVFLARFDGFWPYSSPSEGSEDSLILFRDLTNERLSPLRTTYHLRLSGWAVSLHPASSVRLSIKTSAGALADASVKTLSSPDVYEHFRSKGRDLLNAQESRFDITTPCIDGCFLHVETDDHLSARLPLDGTTKSLQTPDFQIYLEHFDHKKGDLLRTRAKMDNFKIKILDKIGKAYQTVMPILITLALIMHLIQTALIFKRKTVTALWMINTSLLLAIAGRLLMFSLVHVTSFPSIYTHYISPVYPLIIIFMALALADHRVSDIIPKDEK